ncbi:hypothetical protein RJ640_027082 [Escallonia rubra]|uniref:Uncharacterized protein n=1 Tax=Escallonia rubra TaxID=112253 RepID=A0AA88R1E1_9ASTE|nr:hypothetical protein RJ640_027082 [Escallonia rubra]
MAREQVSPAEEEDQLPGVEAALGDAGKKGERVEEDNGGGLDPGLCQAAERDVLDTGDVREAFLLQGSVLDASRPKDLTMEEGSATTRPHLLKNDNYSYWKNQKRNFLRQDTHVWYVVENDPIIPMKDGPDGTKVPKGILKMDAHEAHLFSMDDKAKNIISSGLDMNEYNRVSACETAKEMWRLLEVTHEGTKQVKETKINMLVQQYEAFKVKEHEFINEMYSMFTLIINGLKLLEKTYPEKEVVRKVLRSLSKRWEAKLTAIQEAKDLNVLKLEESVGSLMTHEITMKSYDEEDTVGPNKVWLPKGMKPESVVGMLEAKVDPNKWILDSGCSRHITGLWYPGNSSLDIVGFSDSDYAGCLVNRKSTSGTCQFLGGALVSWHSKKKTYVALSTAEAEYVAARSCCAQVVWMRQTLRDFGVSLDNIPIMCDSSSAIDISKILLNTLALSTSIFVTTFFETTFRNV